MAGKVYRQREIDMDKKILHIMPIPILPLIGPCIRCLRQSGALRKHGWAVTILCLKIKEDERKKLEGPLFDGLQVLPVLPNFPRGALREAAILFLSWRKIIETVNNVKPNIVHVHNPPDTLAFVVSIICSFKKIPIVYDIHDSSKEVIGAAGFPALLEKIYIPVAMFFEKQTIKRSSGIITVSESLKRLLLDTRSIFKKCKPLFHVMRNVDESSQALIERKRVAEENYIFYSGTLYAGFIGLEFFIDSIQQLLANCNISFLITGDGPYRKGLEGFIEDRGLSGQVKLIGHVSRDENIGWIEKALLTVIPYERNSLTEIALPNKVFEYMALGKPVVFPDFPGFREVLGADNAGRYIPGDKEDLKRVIEDLLADEELRLSVGSKNRALLRGISFEKEFGNLLDLYVKILYGKCSPF
jgi:glycosyltransferase involved in cell wall biosynthesis